VYTVQLRVQTFLYQYSFVDEKKTFTCSMIAVTLKEHPFLQLILIIS